MPSETEICNLALSHLGQKEIASLSEASSHAEACNRFYEPARDDVLRAFPWPFATRMAELSLVEEEPNDEWDYSYRYPADCHLVRRILSGSRTDSRQSRVSYKIAGDTSGLLIYCDIEDAELEYTVKETSESRFPPDFVMAFSFRLAMLVAPRVTAGDPFKMGQRAAQMYYMELTKAQAQAVNEESPDEEPESEFIRDRE